MKIGVISDTHGVVDRTRQAAALFDNYQIDTILHCGDVGSLAVLELFVGKRLWFVWGNTDHAAPSWRSALDTWGFPWPEHSPLSINLEGKRILLAHGHEPGFRRVFHDPDVDFLFYGHSHSRLSIRVDQCQVINPGAIHRIAIPSVAVVDLQTGDCRFLDLQGQEIAVK